MRGIKLLSLSNVLLVAIFLSINLRAQEKESDANSVRSNIDYQYFFKHLEYLASDELKGRAVGSEGYDRAADYVAEQFMKNGLLPFGDSGTYFQEVVFSKSSIVNSSFQFQISNNSISTKAIYGQNVSLVLNPKYDQVNEEQKMVFVGYGNILPDENINDYAGVDVKDKMVIVALGGPKGISNPAFNNRFAKFDNAIAQGASGIMLFHPAANLFQNLIFKGTHGYLSTQMQFLADTTVNGSLTDIDFKLPVFAKKEFIKGIFKLNGLKLSRELKSMVKGNNSSRKLESILNCSYTINKKEIYSKNVVALLPGTDPTLKNEYVLVGSHLDHLGVGKSIKGDSIYNGMIDNASGVAGIISISKAFSELTEKPKRSIIFVGFTGEEIGLLGSHYYANRNNVEEGKIVASLNIDMLGFGFETSDLIPFGYSHSNLSKAVDFAANSLNLTIDDNREMENSYFEKSDQMSFIKSKVPSLQIECGLNAVDTEIDGQKQFNSWMKKVYHSPFDDLNQKYSEEAFLTLIKANFLTTYYIADIIEEIEWNEDSSLYKKHVSK